MMTREMREVLAYILGGLGFLHELLISHIDRPFLLTASLALMGFPLVLKSDEKLTTKVSEDITPTKELEEKNILNIPPAAPVEK